MAFGKQQVEKHEPSSQSSSSLSSNNNNAAGVPTWAGLSGDKLVYAIAATSTIGFMLFGYDQGVMSGIITGDQFVDTFPACDAEVQGEYKASILQATYTAIYELGCFAGAVFALFFGNKFGRRRMVQMGAIILSLGTIIQVTAFKGSHAGVQFCIGRVVTGVGNGNITATLPSWQAETSKSHNRGLLVCIEASMIATGTVIAYWIDFGLSFVESNVNWRFPIAFQIFFAILLFTGVQMLPDSPRWLLLTNRDEQGRRVCAALANAPIGSPEAELQYRMIVESIEQNKQQSSASIRSVFTGGSTQHFRRMMLGATSQFFQQIGGCNAVIYFAPVVFEQNLNQSRTLSLILGGVNVTVYAIAAYGSYFIIESVGRRKMFLIGSFGQGISMFIVFACLIPGTVSATKGSVVGLFLYLVFFGATWLELPWLYPAEINPTATRTYANGISTMTNWIWNYAVVQFTPPMLASIDKWTFFFFFAINFCFIPVIYVLFPETAGRKLEEIDLMFAKGYLEPEGTKLFRGEYVMQAKRTPHLSDEQIVAEAARLKIGGEVNADAPDDEGNQDLPHDVHVKRDPAQKV